MGRLTFWRLNSANGEQKSGSGGARLRLSLHFTSLATARHFSICSTKWPVSTLGSGAHDGMGSERWEDVTFLSTHSARAAPKRKLVQRLRRYSWPARAICRKSNKINIPGHDARPVRMCGFTYFLKFQVNSWYSLFFSTTENCFRHLVLNSTVR